MNDHSQAPYFQVLSIHNDIVEAEQNRVPRLDHRIVSDLRAWRMLAPRGGGDEPTLGGTEHGWDNPAKHVDREQADLLELANFAEISDADGEVRKGAVRDDVREALLVQSSDNVERRCHYALWRQISGSEF